MNASRPLACALLALLLAGCARDGDGFGKEIEQQGECADTSLPYGLSQEPFSVERMRCGPVGYGGSQEKEAMVAHAGQHMHVYKGSGGGGSGGWSHLFVNLTFEDVGRNKELHALAVGSVCAEIERMLAQARVPREHYGELKTSPEDISSLEQAQQDCAKELETAREDGVRIEIVEKHWAPRDPHNASSVSFSFRAIGLQ